MQTLSFVPINLHRFWPREWKRSMVKWRSCWCPKQFCGSWTLFWCKNFVLFNEFLKLLATWLAAWVKTLYINKKLLSICTLKMSLIELRNVTIKFWITKIVAFNAKNSQHSSLLLPCNKCPLHPQVQTRGHSIIALELTISKYTTICHYTKNFTKVQFFLKENMRSYHFYQTSL